MNTDRNETYDFQKYIDETLRLNELLNSDLRTLANVKINTLQDTLTSFLALLRDLQQSDKDTYFQLLQEINMSESYLSHLSLIDLKLQDIKSKPLSEKSIAIMACGGIPETLNNLPDTTSTRTEEAEHRSSFGEYLKHQADLPFNSTAIEVLEDVFNEVFESKRFSKGEESDLNRDEACIKMEKSWTIIEAIRDKVIRISDALVDIHKKCKRELRYFEPIIPDFEIGHTYHLTRFKQMSKWIKLIDEFAEVSLFDKDFNLSESSRSLLKDIQHTLQADI